MRTAPLPFRIAPLLLAVVEGASCAGGSRTPAPDVGSGTFNVLVSAPVTRYPVTAASVREIREQIRRDGPRANGRAWDGATEWSIRWNFRTVNPMRADCRVEDVRVEVRARITTPEWVPDVEADEATKVWWRRYEAALMEHEAGHARLAVAAGNEIQRSLERMRGDCRRLADEANAVGRRILDRMRRQQADFDAETRHGAIQIAAAVADTTNAP